jgi:hypothetical protein
MQYPLINQYSEMLQYPITTQYCDLIFDLDFWCFNATFNNISAISWRPVLVVEEARVPGTIDNGQATDQLYHMLLPVECTIFVIYKAGRNPRRIGNRPV